MIDAKIKDAVLEKFVIDDPTIRDWGDTGFFTNASASKVGSIVLNAVGEILQTEYNQIKHVAKLKISALFYIHPRQDAWPRYRSFPRVGSRSPFGERIDHTRGTFLNNFPCWIHFFDFRIQLDFSNFIHLRTLNIKYSSLIGRNFRATDGIPTLLPALLETLVLRHCGIECYEWLRQVVERTAKRKMNTGS